MKHRISQKEVIFYRLYKKFKDGKGEYIPIFELSGEVLIEELHKWGFMSYELPARLSELVKENPGLLERKQITGKSGARYYAYRITAAAKPELIRDPLLLAFYKKLQPKKK